jgi:hypothetical protein
MALHDALAAHQFGSYQGHSRRAQPVTGELANDPKR